MISSNVLIIDDDEGTRKLLTRVLGREGYTVETAETGGAGIETAQQMNPEVVLLDLNLPDIYGLEVLERLLRTNSDTRIVIITGQGDIGTAVNAMKLGATDFLQKPLELQKLLWTLQSLLRPRPPTDLAVANSIIGKSLEMGEVWAQISKYARPDISILLRGESGTGKELFARAIHERSKRSDQPFLAIDCATLPDTLVESELFGHEKGAFTGAMDRKIGKFELAHGGTIFLDEVGNLPLNFQAKLLRVIEQRSIDRLGGIRSIPVDVRIISATNLNLEQAIQKGTFRDDLYFRLAEVTLTLPPLRSRQNDIPLLTSHFIEEFSTRFGRKVKGVSDEALAILREYRWPGNVRELKNAIKSSLLASEDIIDADHLPEYLRRLNSLPSEHDSSPDALALQIRNLVTEGLQRGFLELRETTEAFANKAEKAVLAELLERGRFTQSELCKLLDLNPKTLRHKLKKYNLDLRKTHPKLF
jgi:DNA-binding NtrC family response regulator